MKRGMIFATGLTLLLFHVEAASAREIPREPLDRLWEEHMLTGTSAIYSNGKRVTYAPEHSFEWAEGSPSAAWITKLGIGVSDSRETRYGGLWTKGGWELEGGLLARVEERACAFELYGKLIVRTEPSFILNLKAIHVPTEEDSYEYFLVQRPRGASRATVLRKWVFPPEDLHRYGDQAPHSRGFLRYDAGTETATVTIKGLTRPFEERINLSEALPACVSKSGASTGAGSRAEE